MTPDEFQATILDQISVADILRAAADEMDGRPIGSEFRPARGWHLWIANQGFAHRPIIARAAARTYGRELTPQDFDGDSDKRIKWWLESRGFDTRNI